MGFRWCLSTLLAASIYFLSMKVSPDRQFDLKNRKKFSRKSKNDSIFIWFFEKKLNFARIFNSKFRRSLCEDVLYLCAWLRKKKRITCKNGTNLQKCINKMQIRAMIIMYTLDGFLWHCNANSFFIFISICNFVP